MAITIKGLDALQHKLDRLEDMSRILGPPMVESLALLQDDISEYPRKAKGAFSALATTGQKRAYWARVSKGEITHNKNTGYVRTGDTGRKWTTKVRRKHNGIEGVLGHANKSARWMHHPQDQQLFHYVSGWKDTDQVQDDNRGAIVREFKKAIDKELAK